MRRFAVVSALAACNALTGADGLDTNGAPSTLPDAAPRDGGAESSSPPPPPPLPPPLDAGPDACTLHIPGAPMPAGTLSAPHATITIDGDLADWACIAFVHVDANVGNVVKPDAATVTLANDYDFAVSWDENALRVAFHVVDPSADGNASAQELFRNDSVEVYVDADGMLTGVYGQDDHQWIVDHLNQSQVFQWLPGSTVNAVSTGFSSAVRAGKGTIDYEIAIPASDLGRPTLSAALHLGFDVATNDGDGTAQIEQLLWYEAKGCTCANGCCCNGAGGKPDQPFCDTQRFGTLVLAP